MEIRLLLNLRPRGSKKYQTQSSPLKHETSLRILSEIDFMFCFEMSVLVNFLAYMNQDSFNISEFQTRDSEWRNKT